MSSRSMAEEAAAIARRRKGEVPDAETSPNDRTPLLEKNGSASNSVAIGSWLRTSALAATMVLVTVSIMCAVIARNPAHVKLVASWVTSSGWFPEASSVTVVAALQLVAPVSFLSASVVAVALAWTSPGATKKSTPPKRNVTSHVQGLMRAVGCENERRRRRAEEAEADAAAEASAAEAGTVSAEAALGPPPVRQEGEAEWLIHGMYEHQVLKSGLLQLDENFSENGLFDIPTSKGNSADPFAGRGQLVLGLLKGTIRLQSIPAADLHAAQYGLRCLSLRQLLRLRVHHIGFTPSGCGSGMVSTQSGAHETFLSKMDQELFKQLGKQAVGMAHVNETDLHRFGREALLFVAAASALSSPTLTSWWCWWLSPTRRVFFHAKRFTSVDDFPEGDGGVFEVVDRSKPDLLEPTGRLRWLEWRIVLVRKEANLSAPTALPAAANSAASLISDDTLRSALGGLRKTGTTPA